MDSLSEITAADLVVELGGEEYRLSPLRLKDLAEMKRRIAAGRPDPVQVARERLDGLAPAQQEFLLGRAFDQACLGAWEQVSDAQLRAWAATAEGYHYTLYLMLRRHRPGLTLDDVDELVTACGSQLAALDRAVAAAGFPPGDARAETPDAPQAAAHPDSGNPAPQHGNQQEKPAGNARRARTATSAPGPFPGGGCSASCVSAMAGRSPRSVK